MKHITFAVVLTSLVLIFPGCFPAGFHGKDAPLLSYDDLQPKSPKPAISYTFLFDDVRNTKKDLEKAHIKEAVAKSTKEVGEVVFSSCTESPDDKSGYHLDTRMLMDAPGAEVIVFAAITGASFGLIPTIGKCHHTFEVSVYHDGMLLKWERPPRRRIFRPTRRAKLPSRMYPASLSR